jgi:DMSO/TMAO reductase YedYZ molybdopterin-dependent catalytic subunit
MSRTRWERGLHELYDEDPERADALLTGRRRFLREGGAATLGALLGATVPFARHFPAGLIPAALATSEEAFVIPGKAPGLVVLNDRPLNAETPAHLLDDDVTPAERFFVRNNGVAPKAVDPTRWTLDIDGESVERSVRFSLTELKERFKPHTYRLTLECGGNGRKEFHPAARGNQWTTGAVGCAEWTGARLSDVLKAAGVKDDAAYVGYYGRDRHLSGDPNKVVISRGVPIAKAAQKETLLAWQMNGEDIPVIHGAPLRLVAGGWPASASGKWVHKLSVRNVEHDGPKMGGMSYRVPCKPVRPGQNVEPDDMCIIESMPVKSLVTFPKSGLLHPLGDTLEVRGHAWAGELRVKTVHISTDFGQTWKRAKLSPPKNRLAWQRWRAQVRFEHDGYYEVWARATDSEGRAQPMVVPGWNPRGYLNNACHRVRSRCGRSSRSKTRTPDRPSPRRRSPSSRRHRPHRPHRSPSCR